VCSGCLRLCELVTPASPRARGVAANNEK
jgi:hypothetical protein